MKNSFEFVWFWPISVVIICLFVLRSLSSASLALFVPQRVDFCKTHCPGSLPVGFWSVWPVRVIGRGVGYGRWGEARARLPFFPCFGQYFWQWLCLFHSPGFPQAAQPWWPPFLPSHPLSLSLQPWSCWRRLAVTDLWPHHLPFAL